MKITEGINNYLYNSKATKSIKTYIWEEKTFRSFKSFCVKHRINKLESLNKNVLLDYIGFEKERGLMNSTLNKKIKLIKRFIVYNGVENDLLSVKTLREKKNTVDMLSDEEIRVLFNYLDTLDLSISNNLIYKTLYYFLFDTGVRIDEALNVEINNIDLINKTILLEVTKFSKERIVDFSDNTLNMIIDLINQSKGKYLFWNKNKNRKILYDSDIQYFYRKIIKETGYKRLTAHRIRHTFASIAAQNGMNVLSLKEILGHDNIKTTQRYLHANRTKTKNDYMKYNPLDSISKK